MDIAVWLFPLFAVGITAFLIFDYYQKRGPLITLHFSDASAVEAQKTPLRFRGVNVGKVEEVVLAEDTKGIVVKARLNREAGHLAVEGTKFWIVQPQVDFEGIRGLETLFKGPYIRIEQGSGEPKTEFNGLTLDEKDSPSGTMAYTLTSPLADSVDVGDPVNFRGVKVGSVTSVKLDGKGQGVDIQINIEKRYAKFVHKNTAFWRKVAVHAKMGLLGGEVKVNSFETLLKGGIDMATPNNPTGVAEAKTKFVLQENPPKDWISWNPSL